MKYLEVKERIQKKINDFPLGFAFSDEQFDDMMKKWGLDPEKDIKKISRLGISGGFIQKKDIEAYKKLLDETNAELENAMKDDDVFIEACEYELANHEFAINYYQGHWDTLTSLGFELRKPREDEDPHDEDFFNNPENFNLSEHQQTLYRIAVNRYMKNHSDDY